MPQNPFDPGWGSAFGAGVGSFADAYYKSLEYKMAQQKMDEDRANMEFRHKLETFQMEQDAETARRQRQEALNKAKADAEAKEYHEKYVRPHEEKKRTWESMKMDWEIAHPGQKWGDTGEPSWAERQRIAQGWANIGLREEKAGAGEIATPKVQTSEADALASRMLDAYNEGNKDKFKELMKSIDGLPGTVTQKRTDESGLYSTVTISTAKDKSALKTWATNVYGKIGTGTKIELPATSSPLAIPGDLPQQLKTLRDAQKLDEMVALINQYGLTEDDLRRMGIVPQ